MQNKLSLSDVLDEQSLKLLSGIATLSSKINTQEEVDNFKILFNFVLPYSVFLKCLFKIVMSKDKRMSARELGEATKEITGMNINTFKNRFLNRWVTHGIFNYDQNFKKGYSLKDKKMEELLSKIVNNINLNPI